MTAFCTAMGIACLVYYGILVIYAGITADFAWIWLLGAAVLFGAASAVRYGANHPGFFPGWFRWAVLAVVLSGGAVFFVLCTRIMGGMKAKGSPGLDYVVVLGAQVRGDVPSKALSRRLKKALEYSEENPGTTLILSGGKGSGENISEAECMRVYLMEHGIPKDRLLLEDKSTSTRENLEFSHRLSGCGEKKTGILSNNFHIYRAVELAKKLGYEHPEGIAAESDAIMQVHYVVREAAAVIKNRL